MQDIDEAGRKIGGRSARPWGFTDANATPYRIRTGRAHDLIVEGLGEDFVGVSVSDRFLASDPPGFAKPKGLAHLLRTWSEIEQTKTRGAVRFSRRVAALPRRAMALKGRRAGLSPHGYAAAREPSAGNRIEAGATTHAVLARLLRTCRRQGQDIPNVLGELLRRGPGHVIRLYPERSPAPSSPG